jgi:hypothetical protein
MFDDTIEYREDDVQKNPCHDEPNTMKVDSATCHHSKHSEVEEEPQMPIYKTTVVIECSSKPVVSIVQNKSTTEPLFWSKEVLDHMLDMQQRFPSFGSLLLANVATPNPPSRVHRAWKAAVLCVGAFFNHVKRFCRRSED